MACNAAKAPYHTNISVGYIQTQKRLRFLHFRYMNPYRKSLEMLWRIRKSKKKISKFLKKILKKLQKWFFLTYATSHIMISYIKSCIFLWRFTWQCSLSWHRGEKKSYSIFNVENSSLTWKSGSHQFLTLRDRFLFRFYPWNKHKIFFDSEIILNLPDCPR